MTSPPSCSTYSTGSVEQGTPELGIHMTGHAQDNPMTIESMVGVLFIFSFLIKKKYFLFLIHII